MKQINDDIFNEEVLESDLPVLVDFSATWCPPCRRMLPVLEQLSTVNPGIKMVKIDIEESPITTANFNIGSVPTFIFFKSGKAVKSIMGVQSPTALQEMLNQLLD